MSNRLDWDLVMKHKRSIIDRLDSISESRLTDRFNAYTDEVYDPIKLFGCEYSASECLEAVDPTAYRQAFLNYIDDMEEYIEIDGDYYEIDEVYDVIALIEEGEDDE